MKKFAVLLIVKKKQLEENANPENTSVDLSLQAGIKIIKFCCHLSNTKMDMVVKEEKNNNFIPAKYVTPIQPKKKLYLTEAEKRRDTRRMNKDDIFIDCNNMLFTIVRAYKKSA